VEQVVIEAERREEFGSGPARRLREQGIVPGVVYGMGKEALPIAVRADQLEEALRTEQGLNVLLDLQIAGVEVEEGAAAIVKEIQRHPIRRNALSVDFQWISLKETGIFSVPVQVEGTAPGVVADGGVVDQIIHEVEVRCLPTNIPDHLVADITGLRIGDTVHAEALQAPEGVEILIDPAETVVSIAAPIKEEDLEVRVSEEMLAGLEEIPVELEEEELELAEGEEPAEAEEESK